MQTGLVAHEPAIRYASIPIYRVSLVSESSMKVERAQFRSSVQVAGMLHDYLEGVDREHFVVLMLDRKNRLIGINTVSIGSLTASVVHPREVWKPAILSNAAAGLDQAPGGRWQAAGHPGARSRDHRRRHRVIFLIC